MSSNTKIIVLKSKELIYTGIFIVLGALLILLLFYMFSGDKKDKETTTEIVTESEDETQTTLTTYKPGVYSSTFNMGGSELHMQVTVDKDTVSHIDIANVDETVTVMYPLLSPCVDEINAQLPIVQSIDNITYANDNQYTTLILLDAVKRAIEPAIISSN
ncbi:MAG: hypothetical protein Q4D54_00875 [Eubacteriales bacterium]|nr:hypothetical protein [Lachnospiraceae bacterium]MDO5126283.1 hypothetical protein [Eubacteriales bacterium]